MDAPVPDTNGSRHWWWLRGLGLVWLTGFLWWFYSFPLAYGHLADGTSLSRSDLWWGLPDVLWENVSATPDPQAAASGWEYFPQRLDLIAVAACILAGAWGWGYLTLRLLRLQRSFDAPSRVVFAFGLGLSELSLLTLGCGLIGVLNRTVLAAVVLAAIVAEVSLRIRRGDAASNPSGLGQNEAGDGVTSSSGRGGKRAPFWMRRRWDVLPAVCLLIVTPFVLAMFLGAMLPSNDFDVKEYHLEGPKEFFLQGRVTFLPHNVYTSFPFLTEMLSLLAMVLRDDWFRGALAGKIVLMSMSPLTAVGLFAAGRRWFGSTAGWLCVVIYLTVPWVYRISIIAYAEGGLTFFLFATLLAVMWLTRGESVERIASLGRSTRDSVPGTQSSVPGTQYSVPGIRDSVLSTGPSTAGPVLLCGFLAGSAAACKYPGLLLVTIPLGSFLLLAQWMRSSRAEESAGDANGALHMRQLAVTAGWFALGTLASFGPWMAKNVAETGNPVYPLLYGVFGGRDWDEAAHRKWQNGHPPMITRFVNQPQTIPGNFTNSVMDVTARSDWQSPLVFGCAALALLCGGWRRLDWALWGYVGWLFLTWWTLTHHIDRFWVPMLPVVTLLAGAGLGWLCGGAFDDGSDGTSAEYRLSIATAAMSALMVVAATLFNLGFITTRLCGYNAYLIDLDAARRESTTPSIAFLNNHLPPEARVLLVGGAEVFDAQFDYVYNTVFDESLLERWTSAAVPGVDAADQPLRAAEDIRETFRELGITHVFVDWSEILRYRVPGSYGYTDFVTPKRVNDLVDAQVLTPVSREARQWDDVNEITQAEVQRWGPSLHVRVGVDEWLLHYELFEVR